MIGQLYNAPDLANVFEQWLNLDTSFIGTKIFPEVQVDSETFYTWTAGKEHLTIPTTTSLGDLSAAPMTNFSRSSTLQGPLIPHAMGDFVPFLQYQRAVSSLNIETQVVEGIASKMALFDEKKLADKLADTAVVTNNTTLSGQNQWSDKANSNPFQDIVDGITSMAGNTPQPPNAIWFSDLTWFQIFNHPDFLARLGIAQDRTMTTEGFLNLFAPLGIQNLYIGRCRYNTAAEGQTASLSPVWGKHAWLGYITQNPGVQQINGGYKFRMRNGRQVTREEKSNPRGAEIINYDWYEYIMLNAANYYVIKNAIA